MMSMMPPPSTPHSLPTHTCTLTFFLTHLFVVQLKSFQFLFLLSYSHVCVAFFCCKFFSLASTFCFHFGVNAGWAFRSEGPLFSKLQSLGYTLSYCFLLRFYMSRLSGLAGRIVFISLGATLRFLWTPLKLFALSL